MTSTTNSKHFHTYENVGFEAQPTNSGGTIMSNYIQAQNQPSSSPGANASTATLAANNGGMTTTTTITSTTSSIATVNGGLAPGIALNKTAIESPFQPFQIPIINDSPTKIPISACPSATNATATTKILSETDYSGTTRKLASSQRISSSQNLVSKLITLPGQSPMDSLKEWSVSTFKCTKQLINEKRGICSVTNDNQLQLDVEQLRENRSKLMQMLRSGQQMTNHYTQLVKTQKQLHALMNEMSIKCFTHDSQHSSSNSGNSSKKPTSKQVVANFSSLGNNLSSTTTTSPTNNHRAQQTKSTTNHPAPSSDHYADFLPVINHLRSSNLSLVEDFKKNAIALNIAIKNGEKLIAALEFYCSNLSTLINKTIEDTLETISHYEAARLEYDAERNSLNFISPTAQTSINYSSDKLELARMRYEQSKEDVQIKMKFLEENTIKVVHKQLLLFNGAFASYTSGNTAALDSTLKEFSIRT